MDQPEEQDGVPQGRDSAPTGANPGYAHGQIARALSTSQTHPDQATRERALQKIERWRQVLAGMFSGALTIGSRTPVAETPAWATLEVIQGGFATGALLAEGPLQPHEAALLQTLPPAAPGGERAALNSFYLSEVGLARLQELLADGRYRINVPEEGALLAVAWRCRWSRSWPPTSSWASSPRSSCGRPSRAGCCWRGRSTSATTGSTTPRSSGSTM